MVSNGESAVELRRVAKRYADIVAVDYIDLDVKRFWAQMQKRIQWR